MSKLINLATPNENIYVSDIKKDYIENIIASAKQCKFISKIILFGSSLEERCTEYSDIDIAVFGDKTKSQIFRLASYDKFYESIYSLGMQTYDILYFKEGDTKNEGTEIMNSILSGKVIYTRDNT